MQVFANKRVWSVIIALALCLTASLATAMAYFTDYEQAKGSVPLSLGSQTEVEEQVSGTDKSIVIRNTGETDVFVRVKVFTSSQLNPSYEADSNWLQATDGYWYYDAVILPGEASTTLKVSANVPDGYEASDFKVVAVQESVQAVYNGDSADRVLSWEIASEKAGA